MKSIITSCITSLALTGFTAAAMADTQARVSLGYQLSDWEYQKTTFDGNGIYLDGAYYFSERFSLQGQYSRADFDRLGVLTDWQLGAAYQVSLFSMGDFGLGYRYVDLTLEPDIGSSVGDTGQRGEAFLNLHMPPLLQLGDVASQIELKVALTQYEEDERSLVAAGYRVYLSDPLSLAVHYENEGSDLHRVTFSLREER